MWIEAGKVKPKSENVKWRRLKDKSSLDDLLVYSLTEKGLLYNHQHILFEELEWLDETPNQEIISDPVNFLLANALKYCNQEQLKSLYQLLKERLDEEQPLPEEVQQDLKEMDFSFDYLCKTEGVKDAGHRWIEFIDKWNAFKRKYFPLPKTDKL